jgi:hypothetical protein
MVIFRGWSFKMKKSVVYEEIAELRYAAFATTFKAMFVTTASGIEGNGESLQEGFSTCA